MKKELIKTDNYLIVVDDSSINFDDWVYNELGVLFQYGIEHKLNPSTKKVIAHLPFGMYSSLEGVPLLPPLGVEDDVEKLAEDLFDKGSDNVLHPQYQMRTFFNIGYNKAREKYKFTEEDAKYLFECGRNFQINADITFTVAREHLSQPKMPTHFEFEIERKSVLNLGIEPFNPNTHVYTNEPKTTTNSQGQEVACGKYIY